MSIKIEKKDIPSEIEGNFETEILFILAEHGDQGTSAFYPNLIKKSTFYNWVKKLISNKWVSSKRDSKGTIYSITSEGRAELIRRLKEFNLDFQSKLKIEQDRMKESVTSVEEFFEKYDIDNVALKIEYLQLTNEITLDKMSDIFNENKFSRLLLFIALNHPKFYGNDSITKENFIEVFNRDVIEQKNIITPSDLGVFLEKVVENGEKYGIEFYKLVLNQENLELYFRSHSEYGIYFKTAVEANLKELYYQHYLHSHTTELSAGDLDYLQKKISDQLINQFGLFLPSFVEPLCELIQVYFQKIVETAQKKEFVSEVEYHSIFAAYEKFKNNKGNFPYLSDLQLFESGDTSFIHFADDVDICYDSIMDILRSKKFRNEFFKDKNHTNLDDLGDLIYKSTYNDVISYFLDKITEFSYIEGLLTEIIIEIYFEKYDKSLQLSRNLIDKFPESYVGILFYAITLNSMGKFKKTSLFIEKEINRFPDNIFLIYQNIIALQELKAFDKAIEIIDKEQLKNPNNVPVLYAKSMILNDIKQFESAIEIINYALDLKKNNKTLSIEKHSILQNAGKYSKALELDELMIEIHPNDKIFHAWRIINLGLLGRFEEIIEELAILTQLDPENKKTHHKFKLSILIDSARFEEALNVLEIPYKQEPKDLEYYQIKSQILLELHRFDEVLEISEEVIAIFQDDIESTLMKANVFTVLNQFDKSLAILDKTLKTYSNSIELLRYKAGNLWEMDHYNDAIQIYDNIIKLDPKNSSYYKTKSRILVDSLNELRKYKEAMEIIENLVKTDPNDFDLLDQKALTLAYLNRNEEALETIKKLISADLNNRYHNNTYGEILMIFNEYDEALKEYLMLFETDPKADFIHGSYIKAGECYKELGNVKKAIEYVEKGLEIAKERSMIKWVEKAEKLLKDLKKK